MRDAEVTFDYIEPLENYRPAQKDYLTAVQDIAKAQGESGLTFYDPSALLEQLRHIGFCQIEDHTPEDLKRRYFDKNASVTSELSAMHMVRARVRRVIDIAGTGL
ncbi:hypothetical protein GN109_14740 [Collimonas pratensis]|uniref:hypothetical protein n=1 Tax=Collimonas pratensis TaxID=279113 RepID=UPI00143DEA64|nr:hypothetical protein [Collimonas pratensis]NKI70682.1 hypothetical protein [Collimonas pratensis]